MKKYHNLLRINSKNILRFSSRFKENKGFSLIEVMVALIIFSIIVTSFLSALATATKASVVVEKNQEAKNLSEIVLQKIMEMPYDPTAEGTGLTHYDGVAQTDNPINASPQIIPEYYANKNFVVYIDVSYPHNPNHKIQSVTVVILNNGQRVHTLEGYKTN